MTAWKASRFQRRWRQLLQIIFYFLALPAVRRMSANIVISILLLPKVLFVCRRSRPTGRSRCLWLSFVLTSRCCSSLGFELGLGTSEGEFKTGWQLGKIEKFYGIPNNCFLYWKTIHFPLAKEKSMPNSWPQKCISRLGLKYCYESMCSNS